MKAALLVGFGGPTEASDIRPFLSRVLEGVRVPESRLLEVERHYEIVGGKSPYNGHIYKIEAALKNELAARKKEVPVYTAFRFTPPYFGDVLSEMAKKGLEDIHAFVLSSLRCHSSFDKYQEKIDDERKSRSLHLRIHYTPPFSMHPLFIEAQASRVEEALLNEDKDRTFFIFSAHSIPHAMAASSQYVQDLDAAIQGLVKRLLIKNWAKGYQSRSGRPQDPWLEPSLETVVHELDRKSWKNVCFVPVGFICDNVEVLYDLDIEMKDLTEKAGFKYLRAKTVMDEPRFIRMMADQVLGGTK